MRKPPQKGARAPVVEFRTGISNMINAYTREFVNIFEGEKVKIMCILLIIKRFLIEIFVQRKIIY